MRKPIMLAAAIAAALTLTPLIAAPANAAPVAKVATVHVSAKTSNPLCQITTNKVNSQDKTNLHNAIEAARLGAAGAQMKYSKPTQWHPNSTFPSYITLSVSGSSWNNYFIEGQTHFNLWVHPFCVDHRGFFTSKQGRYVYNF